MTKTLQVQALVNKGDYKKALRLAKDFRVGVTREQAKCMQLAYEAMIYPEFYRQLGKDVDKLKAEGINVLKDITSNTGVARLNKLNRQKADLEVCLQAAIEGGDREGAYIILRQISDIDEYIAETEYNLGMSVEAEECT